MTQPLITPAQLNELLKQQDVILLDASIEFQIPGEAEKVTDQYIPGSVKFDYDKDFCDKHTLLPHMFPTEKHFNERAQALGINNKSTVVVYDNAGTFASPRAWWMFLAMGHTNTLILDGGLPAWVESGFETVPSYSTVDALGDFEGVLDKSYFIDATQVNDYSKTQQANILDARSQARFDSRVPEPRPWVEKRPHSTLCLPTLRTSYGKWALKVRARTENNLQCIRHTTTAYGIQLWLRRYGLYHSSGCENCRVQQPNECL